jgi:hypothetical protein
MKKNYCKVLPVMIYISLVFTTLNVNKKKELVNDVIVSNIEALATGENPNQIYDCYSSISSDGSGTMTHVTYCGNCNPILCRSWGSSGHCRLQ